MSTPNTARGLIQPLSSARHNPVRFTPLVQLLAALCLTSACETEPTGCQYRCSEEHPTCPEQLTCDELLGYCVEPSYTGVCDVSVRQISVCKDQEISLQLPGEFDPDGDVVGLPSTVKVRDGQLIGVFHEATTFAFGAAGEERQSWRISTVSDCPMLDTVELTVCVGLQVTHPLVATQGSGKATFELITPSDEFQIDEQTQVLRGTAVDVGERTLQIAITDERGSPVLTTLTLNVIDTCPNIGANLRGSCAGSAYEAPLQLSGEGAVRIQSYTLSNKDGEPLDSKAAAQWRDQLGVEIDDRAGFYLLKAAPAADVLGTFVYSVTLEDNARVEQRELPFEVGACSAVSADFSVCPNQEFDLDLEGSVGDEWTFYDSLQNPNPAHLGFTERRLVGSLPDSGIYELKAIVTNEDKDRLRIETLTIHVRDASALECSDAGASTSIPESTASSVSSAETTPTSSSGSEDAQTSGSTAASSGESGVDEDGGAVLPPPPIQLMGCVGEPFSFSPSRDLPNGSNWSVDGAALPQGLNINGNTGRISGTPETSGQGSFTVRANVNGTPQSKQYRYAVSQSCYFGFESVNESDQQSVYVGHILQDPPAAVEVLQGPLLGNADVKAFAFDPTGTRLAIAIEEPDPNAPNTEVYVAEITGLGASGEPQLEASLLPLFPLPTAFLELKWSSNGLLGVIVQGDGETPDESRRLLTFGRDGSNNWVGGLDTTIANARALAWLGSAPCVVGTDPDSAHATLRVSCNSPTAGEQVVAGPLTKYLEATLIRTTDSTMLSVTPMPEGGPTYFDYVSSFRVTESPPWRSVTHPAVFASPQGDLLAVPRYEEQSGDGADAGVGSNPERLEVARAGDLTAFGPSVGEYDPLGVLEECGDVSAWSGTSNVLACTPTQDKTQVTFATFDGERLKDTSFATLEAHASAMQKAFVDDKYYVFDSEGGILTVVELAATPVVSTIRVGLDERELMWLLPMPKAESHSRLAVQASGKLHVVDLSQGAVVATLSTGADLLRVPGTCAPSFGVGGYNGWCGDSEGIRRFQMSHDGLSFLYINEEGKLRLSNPLGDVTVGRSRCGELSLNCAESFTFAN